MPANARAWARVWACPSSRRGLLPDTLRSQASLPRGQKSPIAAKRAGRPWDRERVARLQSEDWRGPAYDFGREANPHRAPALTSPLISLLLVVGLDVNQVCVASIGARQMMAHLCTGPPMRKALLAACAVIALCSCAGAARADDPCLSEAYHGRHEQCIRSDVARRYSASVISRFRDTVESLARDGAMLDCLDGQRDWRRAHPGGEHPQESCVDQIFGTEERQ
jgi:hypothetical protein